MIHHAHRARVPARAGAETLARVTTCQRRYGDDEHRYSCIKRCPGIKEVEASCPAEEKAADMCCERTEVCSSGSGTADGAVDAWGTNW